MAGYTYTKINWENEPSYNTPINETNLNHMDQGIFDLAYVKAEKNDAVFVNSISLDRKAGTAVGLDSVAAGYDTEATGPSSVAIGTNTSAKNGQAVAGGYNSKALGNTSLALGTHCITRLNAAESQAIGNNCIAGSANQMVFGQYNVEDTTGTYAEIVGNGSSGNESNARTLDWQGNETVAGDFTNGNGETLHGIYEALPVDTETGNPAVITDAFGGACKSLVLTLEPIQSGSGEKSPQNPYVISGRTQNVVKRTGLNILPYPYTASSGTVSGVTFTINSDGTVLVNGTASADIDYTLESFVFPDNISYKFMGCPSGGSLSTYFMQIRGTDFLDVGDGYVSHDSIAERNIQIRIKSGTACNNLLFKPMITADTSATKYAPYETPSSITRTYGTTIYGGSDDVTGDGATSTKKLNEINGGFSAAASGAFYKDGITDISDIPSLCNIYPMGAEVQGAGGANDHPKTLCWQKNGLQSLRLCVYDSDFADVAAFNTALAQTPMQVIFDLATPTSIPLTAQNITLLHGDNVLTTDADSIEASYSADIALYIEKKIAEGSNNRSFAKGGTSESEEEPAKEEEIEIKEEEPKKEETR